MALNRGRSFGFTAAEPPPPPPPVPVHLTGTIDRQAEMPPSHAAFLGGAVLKLEWGALQPTSSTQALQLGAPGAGGLQDVLDFKADFPTTPYKLRVYAGWRVPAWLLSQVGTWHFQDPQDSVFYDCARWWRAEMIPRYRQLMEKVRDYFEADPYCREVQNSMCATLFAEPMQRQMNIAYTANAFAAEYNASRTGGTSPADGGVPWTHQRDIESLLASVDVMSEVFHDRSRWATALSLTGLPDLMYASNGDVILNTSGFPRSVVDLAGGTFPVADFHVAEFGTSGTLMNNGFSTIAPKGAAAEPQIWAYMKAKHDQFDIPIAFQTETLNKLDTAGASLADVVLGDSESVRGGLYWGAMFIEMPNGYDGRLTTTQLTTANALYAANAPT